MYMRFAPVISIWCWVRVHGDVADASALTACDSKCSMHTAIEGQWRRSFRMWWPEPVRRDIRHTYPCSRRCLLPLHMHHAASGEICGPWNGSPMATNVVLVVLGGSCCYQIFDSYVSVVTRFSTDRNETFQFSHIIMRILCIKLLWRIFDLRPNSLINYK